MDLLAVSDDQSLHYFLEVLHFPAISTYDPNNRKKIKDYLVQLAKTSKVVSLSIHALQHLHKAQTYGLPLTNSVLLYRAAKEALQGHIGSDETSIECVVSATFLIALFEMINYEVVSVLRQPSDGLVDMFRRWHESRLQFSPALIRMGIWLRILNIAATRAGGPGLVSTNILGSLPVDCNDLSTVHPHSAANMELGGDVLFSFYYELEMVGSELTTMAHYYRSRVTTSDQQEVAESIKELRQKMDRMWQTRPQLMKMTPAQLQNQLPHQDAQSTICLVGVLIAAYYGQRIEIGRVLSYPLLSDPDVVEALAAVRDVVNGDWNAVQDGRVSCGYLRPLLLHAVESFDSEQTTWAVSHMKMIRDPIYRSDFYAAYAQGVSDMQILKDRRVTMRYYCLQAFGVDPPFL
ncbi:hypothetical protein K4F52_003364 [Lecanicillium sp. MT-2017a]|nr:hypothetical protein K4F52_003364 [Lecanicillium sp. MT-2017a]